MPVVDVEEPVGQRPATTIIVPLRSEKRTEGGKRGKTEVRFFSSLPFPPNVELDLLKCTCQIHVQWMRLTS